MKSTSVNSSQKNIPAIALHGFRNQPFKFALAIAFPSLIDVVYDYLRIPVEGKMVLHCVAVAFFALDADTTLEKVSAVAATAQCFRSIHEHWTQEEVK